MKTIKRYFLSVSKEPVNSAFLVISIISVILIFISLAFVVITNKEPDWKLIFVTVVILVLIFIILATINTVVVRKKITVINLKKTEIGYYYIDGIKEKYKQPIWGKFPFTIELINKLKK